MDFSHLRPDFGAAKAFLSFLDASAVAQKRRFMFLWLPPGEDIKSSPDKPMQELLTFEEFEFVYPIKLREGYQPFITVNAMKGRTRANAEVVDYRAYFLDFDNTQPLLDPSPLPPHCIVQSKRGQHWYWRTSASKETWRPTEYALAKKFGADLAATDPARVLRMPGSWHLKEPHDPFLVTLERCNVTEPRPVTPLLNRAYELDTEAAGREMVRAARVQARIDAGTDDMPEGLKIFFADVRKTGAVIRRTPGKLEWHFKCPMKDHKSAEVVVIALDKSNWRLFCQSGYPECERDKILAHYDHTWGIQYDHSYKGKAPGA